MAGYNIDFGGSGWGNVMDAQLGSKLQRGMYEFARNLTNRYDQALQLAGMKMRKDETDRQYGLDTERMGLAQKQYLLQKQASDDAAAMNGLNIKGLQAILAARQGAAAGQDPMTALQMWLASGSDLAHRYAADANMFQWGWGTGLEDPTSMGPLSPLMLATLQRMGHNVNPGMLNRTPIAAPSVTDPNRPTPTPTTAKPFKDRLNDGGLYGAARMYLQGFMPFNNIGGWEDAGLGNDSWGSIWRDLHVNENDTRQRLKGVLFGSQAGPMSQQSISPDDVLRYRNWLNQTNRPSAYYIDPLR